MAGADVAESKSHAKGQKKKKKRAGVRIDMTPMVDVAMLLLTFLMLTTVFNKPQTMELNLPPNDNPVEVKQSSLLTIRVAADFTIYWNKGIDLNLQKVTFKELRKLLTDQDRSTDKMITLIKIDREAKYIHMVDIIDELNLANITRFSITPLKDVDKKLIARVAG